MENPSCAAEYSRNYHHGEAEDVKCCLRLARPGVAGGPSIEAATIWPHEVHAQRDIEVMTTIHPADSTALTAYLPFNIDCLNGDFTTAKGRAPSQHAPGSWLLVQNQGLVVPSGPEIALPCGELPRELQEIIGPQLWLGDWRGAPCWTAAIATGANLPPGFRRETMIPMQGTRLTDDLLTLGGMAMQALYWDSTSGSCPRCGTPTETIPGEWGKQCPSCKYQHYPHLHPAVIVLVHDGDRVLLARKAMWEPGRYALVAGFVDNGESLEAAVRREVKEEVGVDVADIQYVGSQNWPFPSQLMVGFLARYAGGEVIVDPSEIEDARWFPRDALPNGPSRHSIAGFIIEHYAGRS